MQKFLKSLAKRAEEKQKEKLDPNQVRYVGPNTRFFVSMFDIGLFVLVLLLLILLDSQINGTVQIPQNTDPEHMKRMIAEALINLFISFCIIVVAFIGFWKYLNRKIFHIRIVDNKTFSEPSIMQYIIRVFSAIPNSLVFFIMFLNKKNRGLHDYLAGTAVIYTNKLNPEWEKKKFKFQAYLMVALLIIAALYIARKMQ